MTVSRVTPADFVETVLVRRFNAKAVVVGSGFRFGKGRAGTVAALRALGGGLGLRRVGAKRARAWAMAVLHGQPTFAVDGSQIPPQRTSRAIYSTCLLCILSC